MNFLFASMLEAQEQEVVLFSRSLPNGQLQGEAALVDKSELSAGIRAVPNNLTKRVVVDSGPSTNRVDLVFLGDGYLTSESSKFSSQVESISQGSFLQMPLQEYKNYFNIHQVFAPSTDSGIDNDDQLGTLKDTALDAQFYCQNVKENVCVDVSKAWELAAQARDFDQIAVLINSSSNGGSAYPFSDISVVTAGYSQATNNLLHQIGHSFANLADEYDNGAWPTYTGFEPAEPNVSAQNTEAMLSQKIKWEKWIGVDSGTAFGGIINTYQGAMGHQFAIYRPTLSSKMRNLADPFNNPSVESFIKEIYKKVKPIDDATSNTTPLSGSSTLFVSPLQPVGRNLSVQWSVDGTPVQGANQYTFRPNNYPFNDGIHVVSVEVIDDTPLMKDETFRSQYMKEKRSWNVPIDQNAPVITKHPQSAAVFVEATVNLSVTAVGEDLTYQWFKNGNKIDGATSTSYQTPPAKREQANYYVEVSNVQGTVRSNTAAITITNRTPVYSGSTSITLSRLEEGSIAYKLSDLDSDSLTKSYTIESSSAPGATITLGNDNINIKAGPSFLGQFVVKLAISDSYTTVYFPITVIVKNNIPNLEAIPDLSRVWTTDKATVTLVASDTDSMDTVSLYAHQPSTGFLAPVSLTLNGNVLTIDPQAGYIGNFNITARASDGKDFTDRTFQVSWTNSSPVIEQLPPIRSHYKVDKITRSIVATDPNGDTLQLSAGILPSNTSVAVTLSGNSLTIDPAPTYRGVSTVKVSAFDSGLTSVMNTSLEIYNSAPVIDPISSINVNQNKKTISVPLKISDPDIEDKDSIQSSARVLNNIPGVQVKIENNNLVIDSVQNFSSGFSVEVSATDGDLTTKRNVQVGVTNTAPVLLDISDQLIHPIKENVRTITLSATDINNDNLTYRAEIIKPNVKAPTLTVNGDQLSIDPINSFLGSFSVRVIVSDGLSETAKTFKVTTYNTDPELNSICDRSALFSMFPIEIPLTASDPDGEDLSFEASVESTSLPALLKAKYNFDTSRSRPSNSLGLREKYLSGNKNESGNNYWFYILPTGELYELNKTHAESKFLIKLPSGYYEYPTLLVNGAVGSNVASALSLNIVDNKLKVSLSSQVEGSVLVRVKAKDFFSFNEKSFLLTVTNNTGISIDIDTSSEISVDELTDLNIHWKDAPKKVTINVTDTDTGLTPSSIYYNITQFDGSLARSLDEQYNFSDLITDSDDRLFPPNNYTGRGEKYIRSYGFELGSNGRPYYNGVMNVFAILPSGDLYKCPAKDPKKEFISMDNGTLVAELNKVYYRDPNLLTNASSGAALNLNITGSNKNFLISPTPGFLGKVILKASATYGNFSDSKLFIVNVYDNEPTINVPLPCDSAGCQLTVGWKSGPIRLPITVSDIDSLDTITSKGFKLMPGLFIANETIQYKLKWVNVNGYFDRDGWREKHYEGIFENTPSDIAMTPDGQIFKWNGSPTNSILLTQVPAEYYANPYKLDLTVNHPMPNPANLPNIKIEGSELVITPVANATTYTGVAGWVSDGKRKGFIKFIFDVRNQSPIMKEFPDILVHWRNNSINQSIEVSDPDGDTLKPMIFRFIGSDLKPLASINYNITQTSLSMSAKFPYLGTFRTLVEARDEGDIAIAKPFYTTVFNTAPELASIGSKQMAWNKSSLEIPVTMSDADDNDSNNLTLMAHLGTASDFADELIAKHQFTKTGAGATNSLGFSEIHFSGKIDGATTEFILLPTEALYSIKNSVPELRGFFPAGTYAAPNRLLSIVNPNYAGSHTLSVSGNNKIILTKNPSANSTSITVTAWATDSINAKSETFTVNVIDKAPLLPTISDSYSIHWNPGTLELNDFPLKDEDGENVSYAITSTPAGLQHSVNESGVFSAKATNPYQLGTFAITIRATSGSKSTSKVVNLTLTNSTPSILPIGDREVGYKESLSIPFVAADTNGDTLTFSTTYTGAKPENFLVAVAGSQLKVSPKVPTTGDYTLTIKANDGPSQAQTQTKISFKNRAPVLNALAAMDIAWKTKVGTQSLTFSDLDDDTLQVSAVVSNPAVANAVVNGKVLTLTLKTYAPSFSVKVSVTDGTSTAEREFPVVVSNAPPVLSGMPASREVHWNTENVTQAFTVSDANGDTINVTSSILNSTLPATVTNTNSLATVKVTQRKMGELTLKVKAADEVSSVEASTKFTYTNTKPTIDEIANQIISTTSQKSVSFLAKDENSDALSLAVKKMSKEEVAFDLDAAFNFEQGETNFGYNKLGNLEKYLKGTDPVRKTPLNFVIYPNGRFYIWTGVLTQSTYLGTLPAEFHTDPIKLINAPAASASSINFNVTLANSALTLKANNNYEGTFWVKVSASDTQETGLMYFSINSIKESSSGGGNGGNDDCETKETEHDGECSLSGRPLFTAIGRIGDTLSGPGSRTFEVGIGRDADDSCSGAQSNNHVWISGKKETFSITLDRINKVANFVVAGKSSVYNLPETYTLSDILIKAKRGNLLSAIKIESLKLNGKSISDKLTVDGGTNQIKTLQIRSVKDLKDKFTLEGSASLTYNGLLKDSELGFDITLTRSDNAPAQCEDDDDDNSGPGNGGGNDDDSNRKVKICHYPPGNPTNAQTLSVSVSALLAHLAHGDVIGECPGSPEDPGSGGISCDAKQLFASPNYTLWNSFLNMTNILELTNSTATAIPVKISFYSINGTLAHQRTINVPATNQFDVIINDFPGFVRDSYGVIKLEFTGNLDGRMSFYRPTTGASSYDYAYSIPLADANFGTTAVSFNTFQPSQMASEANNLVANWLSIVNLDASAQRYTVFSYDMVGKLILRRELEIPSFGRADVDGGHDLAGPNVVGYHKVVPFNVTAEYIAQITRFGGNAPAGFAPSAYKFAFPLSAKLGASDPIFVPVSSKFGESNWIEVVNILDREVKASINYYSTDGRLLESVDANIAANAQMHFNASAQLPAGATGYASVVPVTPYSIVAQSMGYLRNTTSGSVTSVYGSQARRAVPCVQSGAYNLYLDMQNWLLVANPTNSSINAVVKFTGPSLASVKALTLAAKSSVYIPLHGNTEIGTKPNTYGLIAVYPEDPSQRLFSEVMRLKYKADGSPDFSMPVPVR